MQEEEQEEEQEQEQEQEQEEEQEGGRCRVGGVSSVGWLTAAPVPPALEEETRAWPGCG